MAINQNVSLCFVYGYYFAEISMIAHSVLYGQTMTSLSLMVC